MLLKSASLSEAVPERGEGVPQDDAEAVNWHLKAAEQGHALAQFYLGVSYERGEGVLQDTVQAHMWFNLAASRATIQQLHALAVTARDTVVARMTPVDLSEAQRLAREWHAAHQVP